MPDKSLSIKKGQKFSEVLSQSNREREVIAVSFQNRLMDLQQEAPSNGEFTPVTLDSEEGLRVLRHSTAHLLAHAVTELIPTALLNAGPATDDGFFYDIDMPVISSEDFPKIEKRMREISERNLPITRHVFPKKVLQEKFSRNPYKLQKIEDFVPEGGSSSVYSQGNFEDFCTGPHVPSTGYIRHFRLTSVASALYRAGGIQKQLVRIYGTAFPDEASLKRYFQMKEEAQKRDHRKIGSEMDLYVFDSENAPGFPLYAPNGTVIREELINYMRRLNSENGWTEVSTPHVFRDSMWKQSGHYAKYKEDMYLFNLDEDGYAIKPMNCPGHILIFRRNMYSYRDLPSKLSEFGTVYRYEKSGEVGGLTRPRCFTIDDGHAFLALGQVESEIISILRMIRETFTTLFGNLEISYELSLIDESHPEKFLVTYSCNTCGERFDLRGAVEELRCPKCGSGDLSVNLDRWIEASEALRSALRKLDLPFRETPGDAAFYGPKISVYLKDAMGRKWQLSTIQLDFFMPSNFGLTYVDSNGGKSPVIMIHR
ncbi:MAG: threonine--tRNA ligase, partial [Candidatus Thermoplasmatota archaeon]|nr:threonine--tRNA ligase [Candidatus Thermoplasmatota archaeon]